MEFSLRFGELAVELKIRAILLFVILPYVTGSIIPAEISMDDLIGHFSSDFLEDKFDGICPADSPKQPPNKIHHHPHPQHMPQIMVKREPDLMGWNGRPGKYAHESWIGFRDQAWLDGQAESACRGPQPGRSAVTAQGERSFP